MAEDRPPNPSPDFIRAAKGFLARADALTSEPGEPLPPEEKKAMYDRVSQRVREAMDRGDVDPGEADGLLDALKRGRDKADGQ